METNEIKSFKINITLAQYLELENTFKNDKSFNVGTVKYLAPDKIIQCKHKITNDVLYFIGLRKEVGLFNVAQYPTVIEYNIEYVAVYVDVVLKEQMKNLKYVEQLNLFKDGKESNG